MMKDLIKIIRQKIRAAGGIISFADFMQAALYAPGLGYYVANKYKFGPQGDFVTAPEISPLFSRAVARQCEQVLSALNGADILEFGAGSGVMASTILQTLAEKNSLPQHYFILEPSPDLQDLQRDTIKTACPDLFSRVQWLTALPKRFVGVMLANEVIDAFPVHVFHWDGENFVERGVGYDDKEDKFMWKDDEASSLRGALAPWQSRFFSGTGKGYTTEINLMLTPWLHSLSDSLERGLILLIDYGFPRDEYYHPQRKQGTLMCHYRHKAHSDPFVNVGMQDITAHVDFSLAAEAAQEVGLDISGYTNQTNFLLNCGILQDFQTQSSIDDLANVNAQQQLRQLLEPHEMGELFKCMALTRGLDIELLGFVNGDRRGNL